MKPRRADTEQQRSDRIGGLRAAGLSAYDGIVSKACVLLGVATTSFAVGAVLPLAMAAVAPLGRVIW